MAESPPASLSLSLAPEDVSPILSRRSRVSVSSQVSPAFLTGGRLRHGQVIGATDRIAAYASHRPVHFQEVFATLYHTLGIDPMKAQIVDPNGRPQYLLEHREPLREMV